MRFNYLLSASLTFFFLATSSAMPLFNCCSFGDFSSMFNGFGGSHSSTTSNLPTTRTSTTTRSQTTTPTLRTTTTTTMSIPTTTPAIIMTTTTTTTHTTTTSSRISTSTGSTSGDTRNDVKNNIPCRFITVIFARGTSESGNVGTSTGPPFFNALVSNFGANQVAVQGVDYAASTSGFVNDAQGNQEMADMANLAATQCPTTNIVMSGYSQGAMLVHRSAGSWSSAALSLVKAVVVFGDPMRNQSISGVPVANIDSFCHSGDSVCENGNAVITQAHLTYSSDAGAAAGFVESKTGPA